jgi:hypothetical protein
MAVVMVFKSIWKQCFSVYMQINKPEKTETNYSHAYFTTIQVRQVVKEYCCAPLLVGLNAHHIFYKTPSKFAPYWI